jgi:hypothetical protein
MQNLDVEGSTGCRQPGLLKYEPCRSGPGTPGPEIEVPRQAAQKQVSVGVVQKQGVAIVKIETAEMQNQLLQVVVYAGVLREERGEIEGYPERLHGVSFSRMIRNQ